MPVRAAEVMAWHGEREAWHRLLNCPDDAIFAKVWLYLMSMRDGRPAQQINVHSTQITLNASELARARDIVREIAQDISQCQASVDSPRLGDAPTSVMLLGDEGPDSGGEV